MKRRITQEGVTPDRADRIIEGYRRKVIEGVPPRYAEANLKPEVLRAKRESEVENLVKTQAERWHLPVAAVQKVMSKDVKRLRDNAHLLPQMMVQKHYAKLKELSGKAYTNRRTAQSPLAAALVNSGAELNLKSTDS